MRKSIPGSAGDIAAGRALKLRIVGIGKATNFPYASVSSHVLSRGPNLQGKSLYVIVEQSKAGFGRQMSGEVAANWA